MSRFRFLIVRKDFTKYVSDIESPRCSNSFFSVFLGLIPSIKISIKKFSYAQVYSIRNPFTLFCGSSFASSNFLIDPNIVVLSRSSCTQNSHQLASDVFRKSFKLIQYICVGKSASNIFDPVL